MLGVPLAELDRSGVVTLYATLRAQWSTRNGEYDTARSRYDGVHWDAATNPEPTNRYSLTLNYLKPFVDKSVQLLVGRVPAIQVMPPGVDEIARQLAEQEEAILYGTWEYNDMPTILQRTAWDSFVLRRGLIYIWWDPAKQMVRYKSCAPEHFFPEYDGDMIYRCVYVSRRSTDALKDEFPAYAEDIVEDSAMNYPFVEGSDLNRVGADGQTTVFDVFTHDGHFYRAMGNAFISRDLKLPFEGVPFVEFPCYPVSGDTEPRNSIDQLVELNQYLDQLVSQKADIIAKYANPTILDKASGQTPEAIRRAVSSAGAVIPVRRDGSIELLNWTGTVPAIDEQLEFVLSAMFDLAGKPRSSFGQTVTNQSGVVTNLALTPTLQSNEYHESIWGQQLARLNRFTLMLWEKNMQGAQIKFEGRAQLASGTLKYYEVEMTGGEIAGWYKNRIKWPSSVRVDDPAYRQTLLSELTSDPPGMSLYTYLEARGTEDVEAEVDRIEQQLEDPRLHPDRLNSAIEAATSLQGAQLDPQLDGLAPDAGVPPAVDPALTQALGAGGSPARDAVSRGGASSSAY